MLLSRDKKKNDRVVELNFIYIYKYMLIYKIRKYIYIYIFIKFRIIKINKNLH